jgi:transposase
LQPAFAVRHVSEIGGRVAFRERNSSERMFGRLKDYRRIATRYDKLAGNFLAALALAATIMMIWSMRSREISRA